MNLMKMHDPQGTIFAEIADPRMDQRNVALTYGFILRQEPNTADWPRINQAIRDRWKGKTALTRIKEMAWKFAEGKDI